MWISEETAVEMTVVRLTQPGMPSCSSLSQHPLGPHSSSFLAAVTLAITSHFLYGVSSPGPTEAGLASGQLCSPKCR